MSINPKDISEKEFEQIEHYVLGNMLPKDKEMFEIELFNNDKLKECVEQQRQFILAIQENALKKKLDYFHEQMELTNVKKDNKVYKLNFKPKKISIAASIVLLLGLGSIWFLNKPSLNEKLFVEYFTPDPGLPTVMGNQAKNFKFLDAMVDYKIGDYEKAINKWQKLLPQRPANDTLNYFLGMAYLANGGIEKSIPFIEKTTLHDMSVFNDEAHYYLGLVYVKKGDFEKAKRVLRLSKLPKCIQLLEALQ